MAYRSVYISASNTSTNGTALYSPGSGEADIVLKRIVIGAPVSAGNIIVYNISNPVNGATTNIAMKLTLPTFSTTNVNPGVYVIDLEQGDPQGGLRLPEGGNIVIDQTMQVTAMWDENVK